MGETFAMRLALALIVVVAAACPATPPRALGPVSLSLQIATRQSCGNLSGLDYDTTCIAAVDVVVRDAATLVPIPGKEVCRPANAATLGDLLEGEPLVDLSGLSASKSVIFEVRGLHNEVDPPEADPCNNAEENARWLFWGESDVVDLTAYDSGDGGPSPIIRVVVDCRDCAFPVGSDTRFGCGGFGAQCPVSLPTSFCVPAASCAKSCTDPSECFDGARECVHGTCDVVTPTGELCSPCGGSTGLGCSDGLTCVKRGGGDGFCAFPCPEDNCVSGTKCNRLHNNLELQP